MPVTVDGGRLRIGRSADVSPVDDRQPLLLENRLQTGDAQRLRTHRGTARAGTDIGRSADQRYDPAHRSGRSCVRDRTRLILSDDAPQPLARSTVEKREQVLRVVESRNEVYPTRCLAAREQLPVQVAKCREVLEREADRVE